jgi:hypothetical protein
VDLFGDDVCNILAPCDETAPANLVLTDGRLRAFPVTSHVSTAIVVSGVEQSLGCELTSAAKACTSSQSIQLVAGDTFALAVTDEDGGGDGTEELRRTFSVDAP